MTEQDTSYCKHLEEENIRLHSILEQRTTEIDELKEKIKKYEEHFTTPLANAAGLAFVPTNGDMIGYGAMITLGNATIKECHLEHLANLYAEHCARMNRRPLLYRIWSRIVACLSTKKI